MSAKEKAKVFARELYNLIHDMEPNELDIELLHAIEHIHRRVKALKRRRDV
jgi:hypothetical protein